MIRQPSFYRTGRAGAGLAGLAVGVSAIVGCVLDVGDECGASAPPRTSQPLSAIGAALRYLEHTQLKSDQHFRTVQDYAGDWPQCFAFDRDGPFVRDASPFMATFIHHALTRIAEPNRGPLDLTDADMDCARRMRRAAVEMMLRFQAGPDCPDAGTFGFWPHRARPRPPGELVLPALLDPLFPGPYWSGVRAPLNVPFYANHLMIPTDADDTAAVYAVLLDHAMLDGGAAVSVAFERFFADWRDLGQVPRRNNPDWLPPASGAYLTWLAYHDDPARPGPNDVDVVVNANVLYTLGRYGRLDTPGASDAIMIISEAVQTDLHPPDPFDLSLYYPDSHVLHYCVARALREGGVSDLAPAVELLVEGLLASVRRDRNGRCFWDRGDPHLDTAFGALALIAGGYRGAEVDGAIDYLVAEQDPDSGSWEPGAFFGGRLDDGTEGVWVSAALTTAMALEALVEHRLAAAGK